MTPQKQIALKRFLAFGIDGLVILFWAGVLFAAVMLAYAGQPPAPKGPRAGQALGFFSMTLPVILYFSFCEASAWQASIGKRVLSLRVVGDKRDRLPFSRVLIRNLVKFAPWELGHLVAQQALFSSSSGIPDWVFAPMVLSFLFPLWWVFSIYIRGNSPYDRMMGIHVALYDRKG